MLEQTQAVAIWDVRWMRRCDLPGVLMAEKLGGTLRWKESDFLARLAEQNTIGVSAGRIGIPDAPAFGFMVYVLHEKRLQVINFAVHPEWRGTGAGSAMIEKLKSKLSWHRRTKIRIDVPEELTGLQVFLRRHGFLAVRIKGGAYRMEFVFEGEDA